MRRLLYVLYALAMLQLWSCSSDDAVDNGGQSEAEVQMMFDVSAEEATTRGEAFTSTSFFKSGRTFSLWGWMTEKINETTNRTVPLTSDFNSNPLTAVDVTYNAAVGRIPASWITVQTFYWPRPKYRADFFAIYPAEIDMTEADTPFTIAFSETTKTITYASTAPYNGNTDLMYATYSDQRSSRDNSEKERTVYLRFYHAMAQILFFGQLSTEFQTLGWDIEVKKIEIHNMNGAGVFTLKSAYEDLGEYYQKAEINNNSENKEKRTGTATAMSFVPEATSTLTTYAPAMNTTGEAANPVNPVLSGNQQEQLTSPTNVLMVLPQTLTAWTPTASASATPSTTDGYIAVELRAVAHDGETTTYPLKTDGSYITVYAPFTSPTTSGFEGGKIYKYTLTLGSTVSMTAAITPWDTETITPEKPLYPNH